MFTPIETERLVIRPFTTEDVAGLTARRNDPEVARYQDWALPWPAEEAERIASGVMAMDGPENDEWWMAIVTDAATGATLGDLALHLSSQAKTAEVGYTFDIAHWGHGYATEALDALVEYLFEELKVTRVFGMLHPNNPASAMVLERTGFQFEGHTRSSFWLGDDCSDDWIYGMTRPDWEAWRSRPRGAPADVSLIEVTPDNQSSVFELRTHKSQKRFVAPVARAFADALFPASIDGAPVVPWMRAVTADKELAGFVMLAARTEHHPEPFLWRLLIDRMHQRRGIGDRVLGLVEDHCRSTGASAVRTSWVEGKGSPDQFYLDRGFKPTGQVIGGKIEARKELGRSVH